MKTVAATPIKKKSEDSDALRFVDHGRERDTAPDLRDRLQAFYRRHPLRTLKRGEHGIVESLKADRDRR